MQELVLGGGCFWCVEATMNELRGVESAISGYAGGSPPNPTYEQVCSGKSGHAEVVRIQYDPKTISMASLLDVFFTLHDPTTLNRQGNDIGTQYRSVVYYSNEAEHKEILAAMARNAKLYPGKFVTEVAKLPTFYPAEDYHQNYFVNNPTQGYCSFVVGPKVAKARKIWANLLK